VRILLCGDVVGRAGRLVVTETLPRLRRSLALDFVIVNGENAAHGFGITETICRELYAAGVDVITTGNHVWDRREIIPYIAEDEKLLRPLNFPKGTPGHGAGIFAAPGGRRILVVNAMARLFMDALDDPFAAVDAALAANPLGTVDATIVDFHGEATSEKMAMGHFCDGRASLVVGTHSHVPTADAQILPGGTAYQSDAGMCGDYDSVIGMQKAAAIARFVRKMPGERLQAADGPATLCGLVVETDDATGLARRVAPLRLGGRLAPHWPGELAPEELVPAAPAQEPLPAE
jgi:metallophosphoesterase (TIGR00282 family)